MGRDRAVSGSGQRGVGGQWRAAGSRTAQLADTSPGPQHRARGAAPYSRRPHVRPQGRANRGSPGSIRDRRPRGGPMNQPRLRIVILGLSITSSWGNGHATTYRGLVRELAARGHDVLFLERDVEWYASNRDLPHPPHGRTELYESVSELRQRFSTEVADADLVIVGSYVPEGTDVGEWVVHHAGGVTAFYDIDTPVTLAKLARGEEEYLSRRLIPHYQLYLSFTGGPTLRRLEEEYGAPVARPLYCSVDPALYYPEAAAAQWDLGYMGTYSDDRQPGLSRLLLEPARRWRSGRFAVAGPQYPRTIDWPTNVQRIEHLPPARHRA